MVRFREIDAVKGIAILLIVLFHISLDWWIFPNSSLNAIWNDSSVFAQRTWMVTGQLCDGFFNCSLMAIPFFGYLGIQLFFVAAGFLAGMKTKINLKEYFSSKIVRIYPLFWLASFYYIIFRSKYASMSLYAWKNFIVSLAGLQEFLMRFTSFYHVKGSFWFISAIIYLYCLYPIFLKIKSKFNFSFGKMFLLAFFVRILLASGVLGQHPFLTVAGYLASPWVILFLFGAYLSQEAGKNDSIKILMWALGPIASLFFVKAMYLNYFSLIFQIFLFLILFEAARLLIKFRISRILELFGKHSYPIYLFQFFFFGLILAFPKLIGFVILSALLLAFGIAIDWFFAKVINVPLKELVIKIWNFVGKLF